MPEILKERSELDPQFQWDLTPMFESDAAWETALDSLDTDIESLAAFAGKLTDAVTIGAYLDASTEVGRKVERLYCYASQRHDEDTRDDKAQSMYARIGSKYVKMAAALSFAQPEILSLPEETLTAIVNDPAVADYKFNLEDLLRGKPHTLTKAEEKLLASFGEVMSAPSEIYHNLEDADLLFAAVKDGSGETVEVTGSNFVPLEMSTDRTLRENAFHSYYKSYREHINTFAASYAGAIKAATAEAAARNYPSSRAMAMAGENVPAEVYDNLVATVRKHIPAMHRYVRLRKKMLGVDALHFYDVYAPLVGDLKKSYSYETAQEMVLKAVAPLGEDYQATVRKAYAERWIDVYPNRGKRGGAYSGGCYDSNPYILLNFSGTLDSVSTLAHEMGHTIHSWRSRQHQPPQYADYTLFVAEVASTVNENLLIEQLLANENDPQTRLYLLNQYLENFKGTVYRQTMFAEFEREAHAMVERGEALNAAALNALKLGGAGEVTVLHCNTEYPTPAEDANLRAMLDIQKRFGCRVGYSDHTLGIEADIAAVALGAQVVEKHFTLDKNMEGPDHKASLSPSELMEMVSAIRRTEAMLGSGHKGVSFSERKNIAIARKSIVAARDIAPGEAFTEENLTVKRPGQGVSPMRWYEVLGKRAKRAFAEDEMIEV